LFLDGNITAAVSNGNLVIQGSSEDNQILISRPHTGTIRIEGLEDTTVNGKDSVDFSQFSHDLSIQMQQGGDDQVAIQGPFKVPHDLQAHLGDGEIVIEGSTGPSPLETI